jgi:hypothetical protein
VEQKDKAPLIAGLFYAASLYFFANNRKAISPKVRKQSGVFPSEWKEDP